MASARTTRSSSRALSTASGVLPSALAAASSKRKKPHGEDLDASPPVDRASNKKKINPVDSFVAAAPAVGVPDASLAAVITPAAGAQPAEVIPAVLTFNIDAAKNHLSAADPRFRKLFNNIKCRPFEELEAVEPFRTLASSIIGQQISWKAARAIQHKFIRLFDPSLSEAPPPPGETGIDFFPSAEAVASTAAATLRTAGLSGRKADYIHDLAAHFADGRLSAHKLKTGTDQEVYDMLIDVKGIGPWTVEMFSIFSLRRPNILPVGDLGVQKGLLRWVLASHSSEEAKRIRIAPHRLPGNAEEEAAIDAALSIESPTKEMESQADTVASEEASSSLLPAPQNPLNPPATPAKRGRGKAPKALPPPSPFSSSIFAGTAGETPVQPVPVPDNLTVGTMKSRLGGKKAKKGVYLTPEEMQVLTEPWAPYRSLGVWFMWSIIDENT